MTQGKKLERKIHKINWNYLVEDREREDHGLQQGRRRIMN